MNFGDNELRARGNTIKTPVKQLTNVAGGSATSPAGPSRKRLCRNDQRFIIVPYSEGNSNSISPSKAGRGRTRSYLCDFVATNVQPHACITEGTKVRVFIDSRDDTADIQWDGITELQAHI